MIRLLALLLLCALLVPASVSALPITSPAQLSPNPIIIDFENFQTGSDVITSLPNPVTIGGATFTSLTGTLSIYNITAAGTWAADGTEVAHNTLFPGGEPDSAIAITFASPVVEFLVGWGDPNFVGNVLRAYDSNGNLLEEAAVELGAPGNGHAAWIGFKRSSADIAMVVVQPDQSLANGDDYAIDNIHYNPLPAASATLCSVLGDDRRLLVPDQDVFRFDAAKEEEITIRLEKDSTGVWAGNRATLVLVDGVRGVTLFRADNSGLPNLISATLPRAGRYYILVAEQSKLAPGVRFRGSYCLSLESSGEAHQTFAVHSGVE